MRENVGVQENVGVRENGGVRENSGVCVSAGAVRCAAMCGRYKHKCARKYTHLRHAIRWSHMAGTLWTHLSGRRGIQ